MENIYCTKLLQLFLFLRHLHRLPNSLFLKWLPSPMLPCHITMNQNVYLRWLLGSASVIASVDFFRNPVAPELQGDGRGNERIIDLHGLHASEAIHVLKHELSVLKSTAIAAEQRLQVYILVGTGHHTRGSRTPARLPIAVQRFLLEEGIDFTETQPGLLRVVIYWTCQGCVFWHSIKSTNTGIFYSSMYLYMPEEQEKKRRKNQLGEKER